MGSMKRINISHINCYNADSRYSCIISGIPGYPIEDVSLSDIRIVYKGGGTAEMAALTPPENERLYPEPWMFGLIPASGFFIRHVNNITLKDIELSFLTPDARPTFYLDKVDKISLIRVASTMAPTVQRFKQTRVSGLTDQH